MSPEGWAKANIFYEKCAIPEPGSLQEALCIAVWRAREEYKILETYMLSVADGHKAQVFDLYEEARKPFLRKAKSGEAEFRKNMADPAFLNKIMENAVEKGPYMVEKTESALEKLRKR